MAFNFAINRGTAKMITPCGGRTLASNPHVRGFSINPSAEGQEPLISWNIKDYTLFSEEFQAALEKAAELMGIELPEPDWTGLVLEEIDPMGGARDYLVGDKGSAHITCVGKIVPSLRIHREDLAAWVAFSRYVAGNVPEIFHELEATSLLHPHIVRVEKDGAETFWDCRPTWGGDLLRVEVASEVAALLRNRAEQAEIVPVATLGQFYSAWQASEDYQYGSGQYWWIAQGDSRVVGNGDEWILVRQEVIKAAGVQLYGGDVDLVLADGAPAYVGCYQRGILVQLKAGEEKIVTVARHYGYWCVHQVRIARVDQERVEVTLVKSEFTYHQLLGEETVVKFRKPSSPQE